MPKYLILTVGTGTAGKHSNLEAGLKRTLELVEPDKFWLIPSTDEVSLLTAECVRENHPDFVAWDDSNSYHCIDNPDSLEDCRRTVREVIAKARKTLPKGGQLLVNPTSGTKQMSVGAALAALDEGVGKLVFTVGQRADGVVITGTEKLETFDPSEYFAERDLNMARELAHVGAFAAAAALLKHHPSLQSETDVASCLHEWERQNYAEARRIAAYSQAEQLKPLRHHLEQIHLAAQSSEPSLIIIADLLHTADLLHRRRDFDSAMVLICRSLEMGLRRALFEITGLCEPYPLSKITALPINQGIKDRCHQISNDGKRTILNLHTVARILQDLAHPMGDSYLEEQELQSLVRARNELMHQIRAIHEPESQSALQRVRNLLAPLQLPTPPQRPVL